MTRSQKASQLNIVNKPDERSIKNLKEVVEKLLQPIRDELGLPIKINSGYRCPALNKAVGGVSTSAHCFGLAVDMVCPTYKGGDVIEFGKWIENYLKTNNIKFDQLIYEHLGAKWIHLSYRHRDGRQRCQVLTINRRGTFQGIVK